MNIQNLQSQSTARLFLLTVITYAVYPAHYLNRLTKLINPLLNSEQRISYEFVVASFSFAYLSLALFVPYLLVPEGHPMDALSGLADGLSGLFFLIWSFKIRNRLNSLREATPGDEHWFHGFWTFVFQYLYINFKINVLCNLQAETGAEGEKPST